MTSIGLLAQLILSDSEQSPSPMIWLDVISSVLFIVSSFYAAFLLLGVGRRRTDNSLRPLMTALGGFLLAAAVIQLLSILSFWKPPPEQAGIVKICVAAASLILAFLLRRRLPALVGMAASSQVERTEQALARSREELDQSAIQLAESARALEASHQAQKRSEEHFRQLEEHLRHLSNSMPQIVWTANARGSVDYYNERWYSLTGFSRDSFGDASWLPLLHLDDQQKLYLAWYSAVESGIPFQQECRFWDRSSGSYRWHKCQAMPIRDDHGAVVKWFGACTDIHDYKQAALKVLNLNSELETRVAERTGELTRLNDELRKSQTWWQAILRSATEASIMALDDNGTIIFFNSGAERLLGYHAHEVVGKCTPFMFYPAEEREVRARQLSAELKRPVTVDGIFLAVNQPPDPFVLESVYLHRDGTPIDISLAISPLTDADGERFGKLAIAVDMRPRKALEQQLRLNNLQLCEQSRKAEEANRAKSEFLSAMSHEIRTPMNAILGMADLLWESELSFTQRKYVQVFRRACTNLLTLVNDILDLSKIESGRFELEHIHFDLMDVIRGAVEIIQPKAIAKNLQLKSNVAPDTPWALLGDPTRLTQILVNLLGNAVKFTESGSITLTVKSLPGTAGRLHFEVTDTGIGIPAEKLETIFQDFAQAESSTTRQFGGTGLGLGIARRLVSSMGGELRVRSELGKGSTFYFDAAFLPSPKEERSSREGPSFGLAGRRVLIIDDNQTNRLIFAEVFRSWGIEIVEYADDVLQSPATLAGRLKNEKAFDLIVVDRWLNGVNGFEVAAEIRRSYPYLPILMITSDNTPGDHTKLLTLGVAEYAVKPVRRPELLRLVCKLLSTRDSSTIEHVASANSTRPNHGIRVYKVLIAEDSEDNRFLLQEYMKGGPYEITFAENGQVAIDLATERNFDLILMDVQMPVMDGLTAARLIRQMEEKKGRPPVAMLALTANARREDIELSRTAGCDEHISKPIARDDLLKTLRRYTEGERSQSVSTLLPMSVPPGLEEAAKRYIRSRNSEVPLMRSYLERKDFNQIRILAHNIKGTGSPYGFPDLTRLGELMEGSAKEQNAAQLAEHLDEFTRYVQAAAKEMLISEAA